MQERPRPVPYGVTYAWCSGDHSQRGHLDNGALVGYVYGV
jgi:hypothetical protein